MGLRTGKGKEHSQVLVDMVVVSWGVEAVVIRGPMYGPNVYFYGQFFFGSCQELVKFLLTISPAFSAKRLQRGVWLTNCAISFCVESTGVLIHNPFPPPPPRGGLLENWEGCVPDSLAARVPHWFGFFHSMSSWPWIQNWTKREVRLT